MSRILLAIILLVALGTPAAAEIIAINDQLQVSMTVNEGWSVHYKAPKALVEEIAEHVEHEAAAQGAHPTQDKIYDVAVRRLAANEAILYHDASGAHLDIDFSPLESDEKPPSDKALKLSAEYAAQSLESEEGVSGVSSEVTETRVAGARKAYRLTADYKHHDHAMKFIGIIGFAGNQWFYLYYTDPQKDPATYDQMQAMLASIVIESR